VVGNRPLKPPEDGLTGATGPGKTGGLLFLDLRGKELCWSNSSAERRTGGLKDVFRNTGEEDAPDVKSGAVAPSLFLAAVLVLVNLMGKFVLLALHLGFLLLC
jgi:hypothetical protein